MLLGTTVIGWDVVLTAFAAKKRSTRVEEIFKPTRIRTSTPRRGRLPMDSLLHSTGAVTGNRTRIPEMATRDSTFEPSPQDEAHFIDSHSYLSRAAGESRTLHLLVTREMPRFLGLGGKAPLRGVERRSSASETEP